MFLKNRRVKDFPKNAPSEEIIGPTASCGRASSKLFTYSAVSSSILAFFYLVSLYTVTNSCAQQQQLTGGPRDTFPPNLIKELSTSNFQTNFEKQDISLVFDEYIELRDVIKQVVISPPLEYIPKVERAKGFKTVKFEFPEEEVLKEGVTYAINFGESVKDLTEGNEVENLQFLFSTGEYIDSLKMSGEIVDVLTGKPVKDVLFMLYENFADTVVRTEKPYYFGKTDKDGKFTINYLKAGAYKGFALEDQDLNYLFNVPKERIGFTLDSIIINDSTETTVQIELFEEYTPLGKPKIDAKTYGLVKLGFRRAPYDANLEYDVVGQELYKETEGDTIRYWYNLQDSVDWNFYFTRDTLIDTLTVKAMARNLPTLALTRQRKPTDIIPINPFKKLPITFNLPIKNIDTALINFRKIITQQPLSTKEDSLATDSILIDKTAPVRVTITDSTAIFREDTLKIPITSVEESDTLIPSEELSPRLGATYQIDSTVQRTFSIQYEWEENATYRLEILPNAILNWYEEPNQDTIVLNYKVKPKGDFGTINLMATELDSTQTYWFQLLLGNNEVQAFAVNNTSEYRRAFTALLPGKYSLKVIEDLNGNGRWDPGNYDKKLQSERIVTAPIEELRAGWDVEAEVKVDFDRQPVEATEIPSTEN